MNLLDLFSGIGGFSLGLESAGFNTIAFCEISAPCKRLLAHHWPEVPCFDDVTTITAADLIARGIVPDAICGGFPCQDISFAGLGKGLAGERSGLWREYVRLLREFAELGRPIRFVIVENVAALLGRGLGTVLADLAALGFDADWECIPASAVGAPHRRDRVWIVAYARSLEHEGFGDAFRRALAAELSASDADGNDDAPRLDDGADCGAAGGSEGGDTREGQTSPMQRVRAELGAGGEDVADAPGGRSQGRPGRGYESEGRSPVVTPGGGKEIPAPDPDRQRLEGRGVPGAAERHPGADVIGRGQGSGWSRIRQGGWWATEPHVGRVAHGVPARVDKLHGLGNAVVPQIPALIGRAIMRARA